MGSGSCFVGSRAGVLREEPPHRGPPTEQVRLDLERGAVGRDNSYPASTEPRWQNLTGDPGKVIWGVAGTPKRNPWKIPWDIRSGLCRSFVEVTGNDDQVTLCALMQEFQLLESPRGCPVLGKA